MIWTTLGETFLIRASTIASNWLTDLAAVGAWARAWAANPRRTHCRRMARGPKGPVILRRRESTLCIREARWPGRPHRQDYLLIVRRSSFNLNALAPFAQVCEA